MKTRKIPKMHAGRSLLAAALTLVMLMLILLLACHSTSLPSNASPTADFVSAVQSVMPSVVIIEVQYGSQGGPGDPTAQGAAGSGWVLDQNGLIVTNNHAIDGAQTITVTLNDGRKFTATAVKASSGQALAVVKINAQNLPAASIGDSSVLKMGQPVAAIGNSLDMGLRVTSGVVSRLGVSVTYQSGLTILTISGCIETDTVINPGNSGGVLINTSGEVVGITNATLEGPTTDVEGFDYAIAISEAMPVINSLVSQMP